MDSKTLCQWIPADVSMCVLICDGVGMLRAGTRLYDSFMGVLTSFALKESVGALSRAMGMPGFQPLQATWWSSVGIALEEGMVAWVPRGEELVIARIALQSGETWRLYVEKQWPSVRKGGTVERRADLVILRNADGAMEGAMRLIGTSLHLLVGDANDVWLDGLGRDVEQGARALDAPWCKEVGLATTSRESVQVVFLDRGIERTVVIDETGAPESTTSTDEETPTKEPERVAQRVGVRVHEDGIGLEFDTRLDPRAVQSLTRALLPALRVVRSSTTLDPALLTVEGLDLAGLIPEPDPLLEGEDVFAPMREFMRGLVTTRSVFELLPLPDGLAKLDLLNKDIVGVAMAQELIPLTFRVRMESALHAQEWMARVAREPDVETLRLPTGDVLQLRVAPRETEHAEGDETPAPSKRPLVLFAAMTGEWVVITASKMALDTALSRAKSMASLTPPRTEPWREGTIVFEGEAIVRNLRSLGRALRAAERPGWSLAVDQAAEFLSRVHRIRTRCVQRKIRTRVTMDLEVG